MENLAIGLTVTHMLMPVSLGIIKLLSVELGYTLGGGTALDYAAAGIAWTWIALSPVLGGAAIWLNRTLKIRHLSLFNVLTMIGWAAYLAWTPCLPVRALCQ